MQNSVIKKGAADHPRFRAGLVYTRNRIVAVGNSNARRLRTLKMRRCSDRATKRVYAVMQYLAVSWAPPSKNIAHDIKKFERDKSVVVKSVPLPVDVTKLPEDTGGRRKLTRTRRAKGQAAASCESSRRRNVGERLRCRCCIQGRAGLEKNNRGVDSGAATWQRCS